MPTYDEDVCAWACEQARFLREHRFDMLDVGHLADEIENVANTELRELTKEMSVLLAYLLKWHYLPAERTGGRSAVIEAQRLGIADILEDSRSLRAEIDEPGTAPMIWADALALAHAATGTTLHWLPSECPWPIDEVLSEGWLPVNTSKLRNVDLRALASDIDAVYIRVGGKSGARIRYRRISVGRPTNGLNDKRGRKLRAWHT